MNTLLQILVAVVCLAGHSAATPPPCDDQQTGLPEPAAPFRVVWNHPDPCERYWPMNFSDYSIVANSDRQFLGDEIKTYYKTGPWPYYKNGAPVNGGLPQRVNENHYEQTREDFSRYFTENFAGVGVIDFEAWRPLFITNYEWLSIYQQKSRELVRQQHPDYNDSMVEREAAKQWDAAAREMFERTLRVAQELMPGGHWGFYLYPRTWGNEQNTNRVNNLMAWLWRQSTSLYPSIYLDSNPDKPVEGMRPWVQDTLKESVRIQATFSPPNTAIYPFSVIQTDAYNFYPLERLELAIGLPAQMGTSGVVLWGTSWYYHHGHQCQRLQAYVRDVLGPYVKNLTRFTQNCSQELCGGHGRCVRNDLDFLETDAGNQVPDCLVSPSRYHDYHCRCYSGWEGTCCQTQTLLPCQRDNTHSTGQPS